MSALSDQMLIVAMFGYLLAMVGHAAEYALGRTRRVPAAVAAPELVGAAVGAASTGASSALSSDADSLGDAGSAVTGSDQSRFAPLAGRIAVGLTFLAALAHFVCLLSRAIAADRVPWGNMYEFELTGTFVAIVAWLIALMRRPQLRQLGLFVTPVMVMLIGAAGLVSYTEIKPLMPALQSSWLVVHVALVSFGSGLFMLAAIPAVMFLIREGYDQGKRNFLYPLGDRVPSTESLERLTFRLHSFAFPIFTFAVAAGAIWAEQAWGRYWGWDPKEVWAFISWVVYACYLHARATPYVKRRTTMWIALLGFLTILVNTFGVNLLITGLHSYAGIK